MSQHKSKIPDIHEISNMASKFLNDMKVSLDEIIHSFKEKRTSSSASTADKPAEKKPAAKTASAAKSKLKAKANPSRTTKTSTKKH